MPEDSITDASPTLLAAASPKDNGATKPAGKKGSGNGNKGKGEAVFVVFDFVTLIYVLYETMK